MESQGNFRKPGKDLKTLNPRYGGASVEEVARTVFGSPAARVRQTVVGDERPVREVSTDETRSDGAHLR